MEKIWKPSRWLKMPTRRIRDWISGQVKTRTIFMKIKTCGFFIYTGVDPAFLLTRRKFGKNISISGSATGRFKDIKGIFSFPNGSLSPGRPSDQSFYIHKWVPLFINKTASSVSWTRRNSDCFCQSCCTNSCWGISCMPRSSTKPISSGIRGYRVYPIILFQV